jgi:hypothetical protein
MLRRVHLAAAVALSLPALLLVHATFVPVEIGATLAAGDTHAFTLTGAEPLVLESEYVVRPPGQGGDLTVGADLLLVLNGAEVARLAPSQLFVVHRAMPVAPAAAARVGTNRLTVTVDGPPGYTGEITVRVHNYTGINPSFPRAFVVPDAAVGHRLVTTPISTHLVRLFVILLLALALARLLAPLAAGLRPAAATAALASPSVLLWAALAYSALTPQHLWLSPGATLLLVLVPATVWAVAHGVRRHARTLALTAAVAVIVLFACEVGLRLFNLALPSPVFYTDGYNRFRGQSGAAFLGAQLNSRGFNDVEHGEARPPQVTTRVVALGDSMAFGVVPYPANYLTQLEEALGPGVEVINMGVPGIGPDDYLSVLVNEGMAFDPDLVLVSFFIANDFEVTRRRWHERSHLATAVHFFWTVLAAGTPVETVFEASGPTYDDAAPSFSAERYLEIEVGRAWTYDPAADLDAGLDAAVAALAGIRALAARDGADTLVLVLPDEAQVDPTLGAQVVAAYGAPLDFTRPNRRLTEALDAAGIAYLDLLPVFADAGGDTRLYKLRDTHWNLAGNRLAAETVTPLVRAHLDDLTPRR